MEEKIEDWVSAGTRLVWLVSPKRKTVTVYWQGQPPAVPGAQEVLTGGDVVAGFSVVVGSLFE